VPLKDNLRKRSAADLRDERDLLGGWIRQPEVRWLDPSILAKAAVEVAVSGTFGKFADKREIQTQPQGPFDYSRDGELWIDYLSDTGDGWAATQTMAWLLAQDGLPGTEGEDDLPRGKVLLLGGDQVYPSATPEAYEDRFKGPFAAALSHSERGHEPDMYATPGNHDWYDGLASFLRLFCANQWIGGWRTRQRRSYFALQLPNKWWIWAIDIQLDTYIDDVQLQYFADLKIKAGDKVILLTAKPSWIQAIDGHVEPPTWKYLNYFEERMVRDTGARLAVTITGDRHHYARYEPAGEGAKDAPTRVTAGGGGAYLSATHTLPEQLRLATLPRKEGDDDVAQPVVANTREQIYPSDGDSRRLSNGILKLAVLNPAFGRLLGVLYAIIGISLLGAVDHGVDNEVNQVNQALDAAQSTGYADVFIDPSTTNTGFSGFLSNGVGPMTIVLALLLLGAIFGGVDIKQSTPLRAAVAVVHTFFHLLAIALAMWAVVNVAPDIWESTALVWILGIVLAFVAGSTYGASLFGLFMWLVHKVRGPKAQNNANEVFTGQSIIDYKNLLRLHLGSDGGLEIHALGVDKACRDWDLVSDPHGPRFEPRGEPPRVHPIDETLRFDPAGNRLT
jgi:Calcineurin-like phosphoesterase